MPHDEGRGDAPDPAEQVGRSRLLALVYGLAALVVVAVPTVWVATLDSNFGVPEAATSGGEETIVVWRVLISLATAVATVVVVLLVVALATGARRRRPSPSKGSLPLEIAYTAVPVVIVAAIFGLSLWLEDRIGDTTSDEQLTVQVDAFRWGWRFTYPNGREVVGFSPDTEPVLVLPVDRTSRLELRSDDVIHSFFVPAFTTKLDVVPGEDNHLSVHPVEVGEYRGHCAEFCGLDHARMNLRVSIVNADEFDDWLTSPAEPTP